MGIGNIIAGALQGVGGSIEEQGRADAEQRRAMALENLRQQNDLSKMSVSQGYNRENVATGQANAIERDMLQGDISNRNSAAQVQRTAAADEVKDNRQFGQTLTIKQIDNANAIARDNNQFKQTMTRDAVQWQRAAEKEAKDAGTYIDHYEQGADGRLIGVTKTGRIMYGPELQQRGAGGIGSGMILDQARAGASAPGGAAPAAPAQAAPRAAAVQSQTYTQADVAYTAKKYGIPASEVHARMRAQGLKLTTGN